MGMHIECVKSEAFIDFVGKPWTFIAKLGCKILLGILDVSIFTTKRWCIGFHLSIKKETICNRHGDWIVPKNPALVSAKDVALSGWTQYNFFMLCRFQGLPTHRGGSLGISERKRAKGHKVVSGDQSIALFLYLCLCQWSQPGEGG